MNKRHIQLLALLAICAPIEALVGRIVLPVVRRRWQSYPGLPVLEIAEIAMIALLAGGALGLIIWSTWRERAAGRETPGLRQVLVVLLIGTGVAEAGHMIWTDVAWLDLGRHAMALVVIITLAAYACIHGTTIARTAVGAAAVALLCATLYRGISAHAPGSGVRWLAAVSETAHLLVPWALAVAVMRRQRADLIALAAAVAAATILAVATASVTPAARLLAAQAMGFRFAPPLLGQALTTGAFAYVFTKFLISEVMPAQTAWAYLWLMSCGIQMYPPHVQLGALTALAIIAWSPPLGLPSSLRRTVRK